MFILVLVLGKCVEKVDVVVCGCFCCGVCCVDLGVVVVF